MYLQHNTGVSYCTFHRLHLWCCDYSQGNGLFAPRLDNLSARLQTLNELGSRVCHFSLTQISFGSEKCRLATPNFCKHFFRAHYSCIRPGISLCCSQTNFLAKLSGACVPCQHLGFHLQTLSLPVVTLYYGPVGCVL